MWLHISQNADYRRNIRLPPLWGAFPSDGCDTAIMLTACLRSVCSLLCPSQKNQNGTISGQRIIFRAALSNLLVFRQQVLSAHKPKATQRCPLPLQELQFVCSLLSFLHLGLGWMLLLLSNFISHITRHEPNFIAKEVLTIGEVETQCMFLRKQCECLLTIHTHTPGNKPHLNEHKSYSQSHQLENWTHLANILKYFRDTISIQNNVTYTSIIPPKLGNKTSLIISILGVPLLDLQPPFPPW